MPPVEHAGCRRAFSRETGRRSGENQRGAGGSAHFPAATVEHRTETPGALTPPSTAGSWGTGWGKPAPNRKKKRIKERRPGTRDNQDLLRSMTALPGVAAAGLSWFRRLPAALVRHSSASWTAGQKLRTAPRGRGSMPPTPRAMRPAPLNISTSRRHYQGSATLTWPLG